MSPVKDAINAHLVYTFHQDTPVLAPDMMKTIACAVKRVTKNGVALSQEQSVSVLEAFKAITINAAYQYHEEDRKGSILRRLRSMRLINIMKKIEKVALKKENKPILQF